MPVPVGVMVPIWKSCVAGMPLAQPKEGPIMRVDSISKVNTRHQHKPHITQYAGYDSPGKTVSGISFEEYLKSYFQQPGPLTMNRNTEHKREVTLLGYNPSLTVRSGYEPKLIDVAL